MPDRILLPLIVACALFMENLDSTVLSTSLPAIARDFGVSPIDLKLALTSYMVSLATFIPLSGWMADRFGAKRIFRLAILVFVAASVLCAIADSLVAFIVSRFLQGMGGAMMTPVARLVLVRSTSRSELVSAMALLTIPALVGPLAGPPLGGFITTYFSWHWIFLINVPVGIAGYVLSGLYLPDIRAAAPPIVIVTSNRTREIHDALKRRCLYHWVDYPDVAREMQILATRAPEASTRLTAEVVAFVQKLRSEDLFKKPGVAETIDWAKCLVALDAGALTPQVIADPRASRGPIRTKPPQLWSRGPWPSAIAWVMSCGNSLPVASRALRMP